MCPLPMYLSPTVPPSPKVPHLLSKVLTIIPPLTMFAIDPCGLSYYPCAPLPMCPPLAMYPITHVPHPPRCPISICSINHDTPFDPCLPLPHVSLRYAHVPHWPCAPSPMCPIPQGAPISICSINHDTPLTMFAIAHVS